MELKELTETQPARKPAHKNPFNGIERHEYYNPMYCLGFPNPFNGIERLFVVVYSLITYLTTNPFNGIER